jgi:hypothetical protein
VSERATKSALCSHNSRLGYCQARTVGKGGEGIMYSGGWKPYKPRAIAKHLVDRNVEFYGESDTEETPLAK